MYMDVTVLICTFNRSRLLATALDTLAELRCRGDLQWDVLVVDNNSADDTRTVVEQRQATFPVPLHYVFEQRQGKSNALNTGIRRAAGSIIAFTDDDVRIPAWWLDAAVRPLMERPDLAYTGGPVRPLWERTPPRWLDPAGNLGGTIAVKDHGSSAFVFEDQRKTPLGVNMAVRRHLCDQLEGFNPAFGRRGNSLIGQEQAEFFYRSRQLGARGLYVPEMALEHYVPAVRVTRSYFRRWWFWKGISQARLHRLHGETELGLDLRAVRRWRGVPLFILRGLLTDILAAVRSLVRGRSVQAAEHEMMFWYGVGYVRETLGSPSPPAAGPNSEMSAAVRMEGSSVR
jgi:glycosyltransferase involved in cell wall biosynthesis